MKKSLLIAAVIIGVALLSTSCDLFGGKADYSPMTVGNIWNYAWTRIIADSAQAETTTATVKNEAKEEVELTSGEKAIMLALTVTAGGQTVYLDTSYVRKDGEKVLSYTDKNDTNPDLMLDGPLAKDLTWTVSTGTTAKVVAQEDVTVPAKTYKKCWKVAFTTVANQDTTVEYDWFADGTGQVKNLQSATDMGVTTTMTAELTSATIK